MNIFDERGNLLFQIPEGWEPIFGDPRLLAGAQLRGAQLGGIEWGNLDLTGACLAGADLYWAFLNRTVLTGADLEGACLRGADVFPEGFNPAHHGMVTFEEITRSAAPPSDPPS
jgi:uncharacterized protein YjbI with pentapeptide repeats